MTTSIVQNADGSYTKTVDGKSYVVGTNDPKYGQIGGDYAVQQGYGNGAGGVDYSGSVYGNGGTVISGSGSGGQQEEAADEEGSGGGGSKGSGGKSGGANSLIDSIYGNSLTAQERQLKASLDEILDQLDKQESTTYANQMVANKNSNEAMLNQGINSGSIAQAALSSNNALQGNLGAIGEAETDAYKDYEDNLASLKAQIESEKMSALLNDYYNQQDYEQNQSQFDANLDLQKQQLAASLEQQKYSNDYQTKTDKEEWAYNMWQLLGYATQEISNILGVAKGTKYPTTSTSSSSGGSGGSGGGSGLTASQAWTAWNNGIETPEVIAALEKHYGQGEWSTAGGGEEEDSSSNIYVPENADNIGWLENRIQYNMHLNRTAEALKYIQAWLNDGKISESQAEELIAKYGLAG